LAVSEKAVLRVSDLVDWIADPAEVRWDVGALGVYEGDCSAEEEAREGAQGQYDRGLNARFSPGHTDLMADVLQEKEAIGERRVLLRACAQNLFKPFFPSSSRTVLLLVGDKTSLNYAHSVDKRG